MEFKKYSLIENSYNEKYIERVKEADGKIHTSFSIWIVTEKAHGANFSGHYSTETGEIRFARRNGYLKEGEKFYNYETIIEEFERNMKNLARDYKYYKYKTISVYGELIGGGYANLESSEGIRRVQKGIDYCDKIKFMAFDLCLNDEFVGAEASHVILSWSDFFVVPVLGRYNSLDAALSHSPVFKSVISSKLGLPEHPGANEAEGIVIRPRKEFCTSRGDRVIIKKKNPKFREITEGKRERIPKTKKDDFYVKKFVNENRYNSVCSKLKDGVSMKEIASEFGKDVLEDYKKEYTYENYDDKKKKKIRGSIGKEVWSFLTKVQK